MQAVEFISKTHDDVVDLPAELHGWNGRRVRVILLDAKKNEPVTTVPAFSAVSLKTRDFRFNRDEANVR
jgi:hypothetical protein